MTAFRSTCLSLALLLAPPALAETELSLYTGRQIVSDSTVSGRDPGGAGEFGFRTGWSGDSFKAPPYYGLRAVRWRPDGWGWGVDVNHLKATADAGTRAARGFDRLEFTDGLNILTLNALYRWQSESRFTPYAGLGAGLAVPHVEITSGSERTYGYQVTGPAVQWVAGLRYDTGPVSPFVEYKGTYSWNEADHGAGTLSTDLATHALNIGLSWRF